MYQITEFKSEKIIPYARNPRKNDHAVDKIASAIKEFGFRVPLLIKSDGSLVDGHLRLKAANKLGLETVPVIFCDDMTETQIKAFRISVNRMAELAEWDDELLKLEFDDLKVEDFDVDLLGFDSNFIKFDVETFEPNLPEEKEKIQNEKLLLTVLFDDDDERQNLFFELRDRGLKVKV